jgi:hypothetical protein
MIGVLTEITGGPTPSEIPLIPERLIPTHATPFPVEPQAWNFKKSLDYSVSLNYAILDYASRNSDALLYNIYKMGRNSIERGSKDHWTKYPKRSAAVQSAFDAAKEKTSTDVLLYARSQSYKQKNDNYLLIGQASQKFLRFDDSENQQKKCRGQEGKCRPDIIFVKNDNQYGYKAKRKDSGKIHVRNLGKKGCLFQSNRCFLHARAIEIYLDHKANSFSRVFNYLSRIFFSYPENTAKPNYNFCFGKKSFSLQAETRLGNLSFDYLHNRLNPA